MLSGGGSRDGEERPEVRMALWSRCPKLCTQRMTITQGWNKAIPSHDSAVQVKASKHGLCPRNSRI